MLRVTGALVFALGCAYALASGETQNFDDSFIPGVFGHAVDKIADKLCVEHLEAYRLYAANFTLWAVEMLDATARFPSGMLYGARHHLGNFDECLGVDNGALGNARITGKYCLTTLELHPWASPPLCEGNKAVCSAWNKLKPASHRFELSRHRVKWAVCIPSSCAARDIETVFEVLNTERRDLRINITVDERMCQTSDVTLEADSVWPYFGAILLLYFTLLFAYDFTTRNKHSLSDPVWHQAFSVRQHWHQLTNVCSSETMSIDCINGLRVYCIILIVFGHRMEAIASGPINNGRDIEEMYLSPGNILTMNGSFVVDVFFTISGFLICWKLLESINKNININPIFLYIHRYMRLTPVLMVVIFFEAFLLYDLSSGPLWPATVGRERDNCRAHWWTNLLYINNYVHPEDPCVDPAWYLAVDNQLFLLAPFITLCITKWKRGYLVLVVAILTSVAIPFTLTYVKGLDPTFIADLESLGHSTQNVTYINTYVTTFCRSGAYFVGMAFGYWFYKMQATKPKMSKLVLWCGWIMVPLLIGTTISPALWFYQANYQLNNIVAASYAGLNRTLFSVAIGFVITACATGQGGIVNRILSWSRLRPLSRLVYSLYLCHTVVQMFQYGATRTRTNLSDTFIVWYSIGDLVISTVIAALLYLTVERPMQALTNTVLRAIGK